MIARPAPVAGPAASAGIVDNVNIAQRAPSEPANALATDATANEAISQYRTPPRNPMKGPNATSM